MRACRNDAHNIFKRIFGQGNRGQGTVDCCQNNDPVNGQHIGDGGNKNLPVRDMFDHLRSIDNIKSGATGGQIFGALAVIGDIQPAGFGMRAGGVNGWACYINASDSAAKTRHRFGQQAATTANIKNM